MGRLPFPKSAGRGAPPDLRNGAPFVDLPEAFRRLQQHLLKRQGGDREMVEILALVLHHDEQASKRKSIQTKSLTPPRMGSAIKMAWTNNG